LEIHGVDHFSKSEEVKKKSRKTIVNKYGEPFQKTKDWKDKVKKTCLERYGVESVSMVSDFKTKKEQTMIEKYGGKSSLCDPKVKEKAKKTLIENYGVDSALKSPELMEKMKKTCRERYGSSHAMKNKDVKTRSMKTRLDKYGTLVSNLGKTQKTITSWLNNLGFNFNSDVLILEGKELDCYDPNQNLALEYCGLYWHNENSPEPRTRSYHYDKWKRCMDKGIQLLTVYDDEWNSKNEVCRSLILSKLGVFQNRIQARRCEVKEITKKEMCDFCNLHHLQGANKLSKVCFGLFHDGEIIGAADLGRHHRKNGSLTMVLTRLCFKSHTQVVGGSGKLFKACKDWCQENGVSKILSWSDNRYSDGTIYEKLGFSRADELPPDYYYVNMKNPKKRIGKQSQSKSNSGCPKEMTELEWANSRGLSRIWDCGKVRWEFVVNRTDSSDP
jgi:hypothetical protein